VTGRRPDGYHLLQTAFRLVDHGDSLRFAPRADGRVRQARSIPGVPEETDLCVRAASLLQAEAGVRQGVDIFLDKRLPLGGGLGGGSSDAASTLIALNRLWQCGLSRTRLQELALELGADVPFFVFGQSALGEGVGEQLRPLAIGPAWYVIVEPGVAVPTREIFSAAELTRDTEPIKMADFSAACADAAGEKLPGRNDLQPVVCGRYPEVARALGWLQHHAPARMSGSGGCVFAAFAGEALARQVAAAVPAPWRAWAARGLDRHPLWPLAE
jgi:4-diphosphocytidyl-2-C-methyl-D-erythritol kinase